MYITPVYVGVLSPKSAPARTLLCQWRQEPVLCRSPDRSAFAGSVATADRLVRTMVTMGGCSIPQAVKMITENPAKIMGISDRKGSIAPGKDADIVIFDDGVNIGRTIVNGNVIY